MKLEQQVCTLEQAKRLKELSVFGYSHFVWMNNKNNDHLPFIDTNDGETRNWMECLGSAYTVAELGVMLPKEIPHKHNKYTNYYFMQAYSDVVEKKKTPCVWYEDNDLPPDLEVLNLYFASGETEAEARAAMLIYLLENNLTTSEEVNQRLNA